jgi:hypothetical protein
MEPADLTPHAAHPRVTASTGSPELTALLRRGRRNADESRPVRATFAPGEYGQIARSDGTVQWYVRSSKGTWIPLRHERVMENDDGTITLLFLG